MLKILHVSGARSWGGNEQQLIDLIYELNLKGVENIVLGVQDSPLHEICSEKNILFIPTLSTKLNKFKNYAFLKNQIKEHKPDVVHLHTSDSLTTFVLSDLLYGIQTPTVFSKKGMGRSSSILSRYKYNYRKIAAIICVSKKVKDEFSDLLNPTQKGKLEIIYDGISLSRITDSKDSIFNKLNTQSANFNIIHIGNHVDAKSLPTLIKMLDVLVNQLGEKEVKLIQIGEFKEEITNYLKEMIRTYQLENHIHLAGFVPNASSYIHQFDVFVMSSQREGFPLTIYESFYKKTPVVSTKAGGIPEIITDNVNGYLAEIGDFTTLAEKVLDLLKDEKKRNAFKENAFLTFTTNFTAEQCAEHTHQVYKKISK